MSAGGSRGQRRRRVRYDGARSDRVAIFLIRHGETLGNAARVVQRPDNPLSSRGIAQAERLAARLAAEGVAAILASDLARAVATAEAVRAATGAPLRFDPLLQERNFGDIRGTPYAESTSTCSRRPTRRPTARAGRCSMPGWTARGSWYGARRRRRAPWPW